MKEYTEAHDECEEAKTEIRNLELLVEEHLSKCAEVVCLVLN